MIPTPTHLTPKEEAFCLAYFKGMSMNKAAITAGYAKSNPGAAAQRLMKRGHVLERLDELKRQRAGHVELTQKQIAGRLSVLADQAAAAGDFSAAHRCLTTLLEWTKDRAEDKPIPVASANDAKEIASEAEERRKRLQAQLDLRKAA